MVQVVVGSTEEKVAFQSCEWLVPHAADGLTPGRVAIVVNGHRRKQGMGFLPQRAIVVLIASDEERLRAKKEVEIEDCRVKWFKRALYVSICRILRPKQGFQRGGVILE